jgi:two-component system NtrC family sensor kinase
MQILEGLKLETIGRLAGGLAHELNSPAQFTADNVVFLQKVLTASTELLEQTRTEIARLDGTEHGWANEFLEFWKKRQLSYLLGEAPKALDESLSGVMRMSRIVKELKEFAGVPDKAWGLADLNRAIENTAYVSRQLWSNVASVSFRLDAALPRVICDVTALKQAFFNILMTLVESIERTAAVPRQLVQIEIETSQVEQGIAIRFHARGGSFSSAILGLCEGLGTLDVLGVASDHKLALANSIVVRQHHGDLALTQVSTGELTFVVQLPELQPSAAHPKLIPNITSSPS